MRKISLSIVVLVLMMLMFNKTYNSYIDEFKSNSKLNVTLVREHISVTKNFIDGVALHGNLYIKNETDINSEYFSLLKYNPTLDNYDLDAIGGTENQRIVGNLTGLGKIPEGGIYKKELNLALEYNRFFNKFYETFPDVAWVYYTSNNNFVNMYPWVSSKDFRFYEKLKTIPFFTVADPQNNPLRKSVWTSPYFDEAGKGMMVTLSAPIYNYDEFLGVISLDMTNNQLNKILDSPFEGYLIDDENMVISSNSNSLPVDSIIKLEDLLKINSSDIGLMKNIDNDTIQALGGYYIYTERFDEAPWTLFYRVPIISVIAESVKSTLPIFLISILLFWLINQMEKRRKGEEVLKEERGLFKTILFSINEGIIVTDKLGRVIMMNQLAEKYTGWSNDEAKGQNFDYIFNNINLLTGEKSPNPVKMAIETGESNISKNYSGVISKKDGLKTYLLGGTSPIISDDGIINGAVAAFRDVTKEYEQEKEIEGFLNVNLDMLCVIDINGIILKANKKFLETLGYMREEVEGEFLISFVHQDDLPISLKLMENARDFKTLPYNFTFRCRCKDGSYKYIEWLQEERFGKYIYSSARDVTEKVSAAERLENLAIKDQLTGLYNRHFLDTIIVREIEVSEKNGIPLSMIMMDIDHFKNVNDTWGHAVGDELLKDISKIMEQNIRSTDILVRFGGEEFIIIMPQTSIEGAKIAAEKIRKMIEQNIHPVTQKQTASFGVAERAKGETFDDFNRRADEALYRAKKEGRNRVVDSK